MAQNLKTEKPPNKKKNKRSRNNGFEEWGGYMEAKKTKLKAQFENKKLMGIGEEPSEISNIFHGVSIYVNGYTKPTAEELKRIMMLHGGTYHHYYSITRTSHMIATNLPDSKVISLKGRKVVSPDWIMDSIKAGKLLPDINYMLYTPEITDRQSRLQLTNIGSKNSCIPLNNSTISEGTSGCNNNSTVNNSNCTVSNSNNECPSIESHKDSTTTGANRSFTASEALNSADKSLAIKAGHPAFVSEFYNHSRLHHIATAGQELKSYVQQLAVERKGKPFPGREKLRQQRPYVLGNTALINSKTIIHLDMDCFFVSVGLKNHPELKGQPVAVTHSKGKRGTPTEGSNIEYEANYYYNKLHRNKERFEDDEEEAEKHPKISKNLNEYGSLSEIASCSYEARQAGIKNGMFLGKALKLCPNLKTIPYDFEGYSETSKLLYDIVASYTLDIEALSCDELYIDCTEILQDICIPATEFARALRDEIYEKTKCTASAGIGKNMLLARLATKVAKPNGQYFLSDDLQENFMKRQLVKELPGVGYSTTAKLQQLEVRTCGDLQKWSLQRLQQEFGPKTGQTLFEHSRGIDHKTVTLEKDRKSVSAEINYGIRFQEEQEIYNFIQELAVEIEQRLKKIDKKGRSLSLKLRIRKDDAPMETAKFMGHGICDSICKSTVLRVATDDANTIGLECCAIARALKIKPQDYRGLGIQIGKLEASLRNSNVKTITNFLTRPSGKDENKESDLNFKPNQKPGTAVISSEKHQESIQSVRDKPLPIHNKKQENEEVCENVPPPYSQSAYYAQISQIDQSVLDALPDDLRQELLDAQSRKQRSPRKVVSPSKANKANANKRGRPSGVKSKKGKSLNVSPQKTMKDYQKVTSVKDAVPNTNTTSLNGATYVASSSTASHKKAQLGGASELEEVRELIKEWMETTEVPIEEDIEHLKNYLIPLVEEDLEKTDLVLKYFHRLASAAKPCWKDAYLLILSYVQQKMLQDVGYMLKARDSF